MPQPHLQFLVNNLSKELKDGDRVLVMVPGDDDTGKIAIGNLLRYGAPRHPSLDLEFTRSTNASALEEAADKGIHLALLSCTDKTTMENLPGHSAVLFAWSNGGWQPTRSWTYPPSAKESKWAELISWPTNPSAYEGSHHETFNMF